MVSWKVHLQLSNELLFTGEDPVTRDRRGVGFRGTDKRQIGLSVLYKMPEFKDRFWDLNLVGSWLQW